MQASIVGAGRVVLRMRYLQTVSSRKFTSAAVCKSCPAASCRSIISTPSRSRLISSPPIASRFAHGAIFSKNSASVARRCAASDADSASPATDVAAAPPSDSLPEATAVDTAPSEGGQAVSTEPTSSSVAQAESSDPSAGFERAQTMSQVGGRGQQRDGRQGRGGGKDSRPPRDLGRRVFVANLSFETQWMTLKDYFKQIGPVSYAEIKLDGRGPEARSKGCGIVEFENAEDAHAAVERLHDSELDGRSILVRADRGSTGPRSEGYEDRPGGRDFDATRGGRGGQGGRGGRGGRGPGANAGMQIVVHGLPYRVTWQDLKDIGNEASGGQCSRAEVITNPADGRSRGFGTILFVSGESAEAAIQAIQGSELDGRFLTAKMDEYA